MSRFRVNTIGLNLRTEPVARPSNRIAVLAEGQDVDVVSSADDATWVLVRTRVNGRVISGFVARRYLVPAPEPENGNGGGATSMVEVHLAQAIPRARRDVAAWRAFRLLEPGQPTRRHDAAAGERAGDLIRIVDWLDVEHSARYARTGTTTFCNIYAHDYCALAGVFLPRVWWNADAIVRLERGERVEPRYDATVREVNANGLFSWLAEYGSRFGWRRIFDADELQAGANRGEVGVICAQRAELNQPGHISVVVPEGPHAHASRRGSHVSIPLQSQAGASNRRWFARTWWTSPAFRQFGWWLHD